MRASLIVGGLIAASLSTLSHGACPSGVSTELKVSGSTICVFMDDSARPRQQMLRTWIDRSARIVADYYGMFPAFLVVIRLQGMDGSGVGGGRTAGRPAP